MKSILIPTDFSVYAKSALLTGAYIAKQTGAAIHLLTICKAPEEWNRLGVEQQQKYPNIEANIVEAEIKLQKLSEDPVLKNINVFTSVAGGAPYEQIVAYANRLKIDLIVMGAHGENDTDGPFIGSTAQKVLRRASGLVLSVKKNFKPRQLKNIVFASDFHPSPNLNNAFKKIKKFVTALKGDLQLVYINTPAHFLDTETMEANLRAFASLHKDLKPQMVTFADYHTEPGIVKASKRVNADLLCLATHNRKLKSNYLLGVTETVLFHSEIPVLSQVL